MLCRADAGNAKNFKCPYHGWIFGLNGAVLSVAYPPDIAAVVRKDSDGLIEMAKLGNYAGLIFGTWDPQAPSLEDYLGDSRFYIDLFANRTPAGMEVFGPPQRWVFSANWKLGALNFGTDGPHAAAVHGPITYLTLAVPREAVVAQLMNSPAIVMGNGHNGILLFFPPEAPDFAGFSPDLVPLYRKKLNDAQFRFMARSLTKVMTAFPNTSWVESTLRFDPQKPPVSFCNLRTWQPLGAQKTEVWNWMLIEKEAAEAFRRESYEIGIRTFSAAGTFDQDDSETWSSINLGCRGTMGARYTTDFRGVRYYRNRKMEDFPGPGAAYPSTYSEMSEFNLLLHWQKCMERAV
jgi:phenylpropionate dioxygenase-like ring-hydroxylating dioxygenase large terminal subunit